MQQKETERPEAIGPIDWLKRVPYQAAASSQGLGWVGLQATRFRAAPDSELNQPAISHHRLFLVTRPPQTLDLRYEGGEQLKSWWNLCIQKVFLMRSPETLCQGIGPWPRYAGQ